MCNLQAFVSKLSKVPQVPSQGSRTAALPYLTSLGTCQVFLQTRGTEPPTEDCKRLYFSIYKLTSLLNRYGILIEQNYDGGDLHGDPTSGVPITGLTVKSITGTSGVTSSGYNVVIVCGSGACTGWTWSGVTVTGGKKYASCQNVPSVAACV